MFFDFEVWQVLDFESVDKLLVFLKWKQVFCF
jgi:hypothetical protein